MIAWFLWDLCDHDFQLCCVLSRGLPDDLYFYVCIIMNQRISHSADVSPRVFGVPLSNGFRDVLDGFANNINRSLKRKKLLAIPKEFFSVNIIREFFYRI
jgi:hypothetical protein